MGEQADTGVTITRAQRRDRFTVVNNATIEDARLSFRALGLLVYILSKPDNWKTHINQLCTTHGEGREAVRTAILELEKAGYITRKWIRDPGETAPKMHYLVSEVATPPACPESRQPGSARPGSGLPGSWKPRNRVTKKPAASKEGFKEVVTTENNKDSLSESLETTELGGAATREGSLLEQEAARITAEVGKVRRLANPAAYQRAVVANLASQPPPPTSDPLANAIAVGWHLADMDEDTEEVVELLRRKFAGNPAAAAAGVAALLEARGADLVS